MLCFRCNEEIFLKAHEEKIDGVIRLVCGKCVDVVCDCCGKTKRLDGIMRWSKHVNPENGEMVTLGSCCTFVAGKMDMFKYYSEKYNNLKKNDPNTYQKLMEDTDRKLAAQQQRLNNPAIADRLIDNWKDTHGKARKAANQKK